MVVEQIKNLNNPHSSDVPLVYKYLQSSLG